MNTPHQMAVSVLTKVAAAKKKKNPRVIAPLMLGALGGSLARTPLIPAQKLTLSSFKTRATTAQTEKDAIQLAKKLLQISDVPSAKNMPVYGPKDIPEALRVKGPHYLPKAGFLRRLIRYLPSYTKDYITEILGKDFVRGTPYVHVGGTEFFSGRNPFVVAHEVGHATPKTFLGRGLQSASTLGTLAHLPAMGLLAAGAIATRKDDPEVSKMVSAAPWIAGAGALGVQGEELRASLRGVGLLRKAKYPALKHLKKMFALQQGAYVLSNLSKALPVLGGSLAIKHWHKSNKK